ncbi:MAG: hypothetical protein IRZ24_18135 [Thermogemmatispora sp.]|uniref:hypothetical protein n=1 Tax=Thermogemmatispora sp. TaxID=1968838 RepID=UPI001DF14DFF|nr:hypothetical protein [Thermogemmatispora sp.]MBX5451987.1 hypothetical protein [Thermogemmatispora sp.]
MQVVFERNIVAGIASDPAGLWVGDEEIIVRAVLNESAEAVASMVGEQLPESGVINGLGIDWLVLTAEVEIENPILWDPWSPVDSFTEREMYFAIYTSEPTVDTHPCGTPLFAEVRECLSILYRNGSR